MKKIVCLLLAALMFMGLYACDSEVSVSNKLKIVTVAFPEYDFARAVAGDLAEITMLIPPGGETHGYEPTVSDIKAVSNCDLFIYTGGESDTWVENMLDSVDNKALTTVVMAELVTPVCTDEHSHDHDHSEDSKFTADEHVWTSPENAIILVDAICRTLSEIDAENKETFAQNAKVYTDKLSELDKNIRNAIESSERKTLVFGDRFPLAYFANAYKLEHLAAFSGCSEDTEASAQTVAKLIDYVNENNIPAIFVNELSSTSIANQIANETGAEVLTFYSCHKVSKDDFESGKTYIDIMSRNIENLDTALN